MFEMFKSKENNKFELLPNCNPKDRMNLVHNVQVYKFSDGTYHVSFDSSNGHETFSGSKQQVVQAMTQSVRRIMKMNMIPCR